MVAVTLRLVAAILVASFLLPAKALYRLPWDGQAQSSLKPTSSLQDIAQQYGVSLHSAVGQSRCEKGKKCIGIVLLAGLVETDPIQPGMKPRDADKDACPQFGKGTTTAVCNFLCGVLANIAHHVPFFKRLDSDAYSFDVVLMHDMSFRKEALDLISAMGARTLLLDDSIKRKSCRAFLAKNDASSFKHKQERPLKVSTCDTAPFDHEHFTPANLLMFLQQLKLGALGLFEYDAVSHLDIDMFIKNPRSITQELDFYFSKDMALMAPMGKLSPLNAGHWVARPSPTTLSLWLEAVTVSGFNSTHGWGNAQKVVPNVEASLRANVRKVGTRDWDFVGADRDQGLLYYIFAIQLNGWYAEAPAHMMDASLGKRNLTFATESQVRFTDFNFLHYDDEGIVHMCGVGKPWDNEVCSRDDLPSSRLVVLRDVLPPIVKGMEDLRHSVDSEFVNQFCYPRLYANAKQCDSSASKLTQDAAGKLPGKKRSRFRSPP